MFNLAAYAQRVVDYNRQLQALHLVCEKDKPRMKAAVAESKRLVEQTGCTPTEAVRRVRMRLVTASGLDPADDLPEGSTR